MIIPSHLQEERNIKICLLLVNIKDIDHCELHKNIKYFLPTIDKVNWRPQLVVGLREDDEVDVLLVTTVLAVQELVEDLHIVHLEFKC